ncbi:hypothetical protein H4Q26_010095 [Puccinia striiformis f. sp. tritici PST-130]|nr:hypothetical protein H4Q26_010095 [Puccinia striiformis f. sp. tritici PST-130]
MAQKRSIGCHEPHSRFSSCEYGRNHDDDTYVSDVAVTRLLPSSLHSLLTRPQDIINTSENLPHIHTLYSHIISAKLQKHKKPSAIRKEWRSTIPSLKLQHDRPAPTAALSLVIYIPPPTTFGNWEQSHSATKQPRLQVNSRHRSLYRLTKPSKGLRVRAGARCEFPSG